MKKIRQMVSVQKVSPLVVALAVLGGGMGAVQATTVTFATSPAPANNSDLPPSFASNAASDGNGWTTSDGTGATPDIALIWAPTGGTVTGAADIDILEFHSSATFAGAGFTVPVLQFDVDASNHTDLPADPTIDFLVTGGFSIQFNSLEIGNATDQTEAAYGWTINIVRLSDMTTVLTRTTALMAAGNRETVAFNYTGAPGENYRMVFDDGGANRVRTAIDNVSFSQVPEPGAAALLALAGLGLVRRSRPAK